MNTYILKKSYAILRITGNKIDGDIKIDLEDIERVKIRSWYIKDKSKNGNHYVAAKMNNKTIKLHRFIMNENDPEVLIDHIDRDTFNNTKLNLRKVSYSENNLNTKIRSTNKSGVNGVRFGKGQIAKNGKKRSDYWEAICTKDGKVTTKRFSISIYGENAKKLAIEFRKEFDKKHNVLTGR